jgi:23S rRNA pseudouridine1911/1915/1917 synthase
MELPFHESGGAIRLYDGYEYRERLGPEADGLPLIDHLERRYSHSTAAEWCERIEAGAVLLDARPARADERLRRGQTLAWRRPPWHEPDAPISFAILHEDADLVVVAKPAGLPTLPGGGFLRMTLLGLVRAHAPDAAPLHRLGRFTSGVVLFARTQTARAKLTADWSSPRVVKRYRALASGRPEFETLEVTTPIGPVPHALLGTVHAASPVGRPASSRVSVIERRADGFLCDVHIVTGRPHQIRIHLAAAGHPLVGDPLYACGGRPPWGTRALPGDPGYLLHSAELAFRHPRTNRSLSIECPPPAALVAGT